MKRLSWITSLLFLAGLYLLTMAAPAVAPYSPRQQFRQHAYRPPDSLRWVDRQGKFHWRPFVDEGARSEPPAEERRLPIRLLTEGSSYRFMGGTFRTHLFGTEDPQRPLFVLGTDALGRDLFSRLLYGAQFSLTIGLVSILFTLIVGVGLGAVSGYFGGWLDVLVMRVTDLFLSLPGLFLILGIRAVFPLELSAGNTYWLIVVIFTLMGWGVVTRVIRGQILSLKTRDWVLAARAAGATHWRILSRHILPFTYNYLVVQATVLVPGFILGEITLSFLGVGIQEPDVSWGSLLAAATSVSVMQRYPWLLTPALMVFLTVFAFNLVGDELKIQGRHGPRWW